MLNPAYSRELRGSVKTLRSPRLCLSTYGEKYRIQSESVGLKFINLFQVPRKFRILQNIPDHAQYIWIEKIEEPKEEIEEKKEKKKIVPKETRLLPKKISLTGLRGKQFILARRKMCKPKFLP